MVIFWDSNLDVVEYEHIKYRQKYLRVRGHEKCFLVHSDTRLQSNHGVLNFTPNYPGAKSTVL